MSRQSLRAVAVLFSFVLLGFLVSGCGSGSSSIAVTIAPPSSTTVNAGASAVTVSASVTNDAKNGGVTWALSPSTCGTLSSSAGSATYTPPAEATLNADCTATITATSVSDPSKSTTLSLTIKAVAITVPTGENTTQPLDSNQVSSLTANITNDSSGTATLNWAITNSVVPGAMKAPHQNASRKGTSLSSACGTLSSATGTTVNYTANTVAGACTDTITVSTSVNSSVTKVFTITVNPALGLNVPATLPNGVQGVAYGPITLTATGGSAPYTWSATGLPAGLTLNASTGVLSGTPTGYGAANVTAKVTDAASNTALVGYSLSIAPPPLSITTTTIPNGVYNTAYQATLAATGGTSPIVWTLTAGSLPTGVTVSTGGTISGTPTTYGNFSPTFTATDSSTGSFKQTKTVTLSFTINTPTLTISTTSLPNVVAGNAYSQQLAASGGYGTLTWTVSAGALPANVTLSSSGLISGTPTTAGTYTFTAQAQDAATGTFQQTVTKQLTITVVPTLTISTTTLPSGTVGTAYSQTLVSNGGVTPITWSLATGSGALPAGLTLSNAGVISGTPTTPVVANITVQAQDSGTPQQKVTQNLSLTVNPVALTITTTQLFAATVGVSYSGTLSATGGFGALTWTVGAPGLPSGLTLNASTGVISGKAATYGSYSLTYTVTDSSPAPLQQSQQVTLVLTVNPVALTATLASQPPQGIVGTAYSATSPVSASGGTTPYTWSADTNLPPGLTIDPATGNLSGTPQTAGTFSPMITVTDSATGTFQQTKSVQVSITIYPTLILTTSTLPNGVLNAAYSQQLVANGGSGNLTWTLASGTLPTSVTLSTSGLLSGTPSAAGTYNFTVQVQDSGTPSQKKTQAYTVIIYQGLGLTPSSVPNGEVNLNYPSTTIGAVGGAQPYTISLLSGSLPPGVTFNASTGVLSGKPTTATGSPFAFTMQVVDSSTPAQTKTQAYSITVYPALSITSSAPASVVQGQAYSYAVQVGTPNATPLVYAATGLPSGVTINTSTGAVSGTPTVSGSFPVMITVTDALGGTSSQNYTLTVIPTLSISPATLPNGDPNTAYTPTTLSATGGTPTYSWSATGLPAGLSINSSIGTISGTTGVSGQVNVQVTVTDSGAGPLQQTASRTLPLTINPALSITSTGLPSASIGNNYSQQLTGTGGTGTYTWSATGFPASGWLHLSTGGLLTGAPGAGDVGTVTLSVTMKDSLNASTTTTVTFTVSAAPIAVTITTPGSSTLTLNASDQGGNVTQAFTAHVANDGSNQGVSWLVTNATCGTIPQPSNTPSDTPVTFTAGQSSQITGSCDTTVTATSITDPSKTASVDVTVYPVTVTVMLNSNPVNANQTELVSPGGTLTFTVATGNDVPPYSSDPGVTWNLPQSYCGTFTQTDAFHLSYTAPNNTNCGTSFIAQPIADASKGFNVNISVNQLLGIGISQKDIGKGMVGMPYGVQFWSNGGSYPYTWSFTGLPTGFTGVSVNDSSGNYGLVYATPSTAVTAAPFSASLTDATSTEVTGNFSVTVVAQPDGTGNSRLNGHYACVFHHYRDSGDNNGNGTAYRGGAVLAFASDGNGNVTGGEIDINDAHKGYRNPTTNGAVGGSYKLDSNNQGFLILTVGGSSNQTILALGGGLVSSGVINQFRFTEMDDVGYDGTQQPSYLQASNHNGGGVCFLQNGTNLSSTPISNGGYVFSGLGEDEGGNPAAQAGAFTASSGSITNGVEDEISGANSPSLANSFTGTYSAPDSWGRVTTTCMSSGASCPGSVVYLTDQAKGYTVYMTTANHTTDEMFTGQMRPQTGNCCSSSAAMNGAAVLYMTGAKIDSSTAPATVNYSAFVAHGTATSGSLSLDASVEDTGNDNNNSGSQTPSINQAVGTYPVTVASNGRAPVSGGPIFYFYDTNSAMVLNAQRKTTDSQLEVGWMEPQVNPTANSGKWVLADLASNFFMGDLPTGDYTNNTSIGVVGVTGTGALSPFFQDSGGPDRARWEDVPEDDSGNLITLSISLQDAMLDPNGTLGIYDIVGTVSGTQQTMVYCFGINVVHAINSSTNGRFACIDAQVSGTPSLTVAQE